MGPIRLHVLSEPEHVQHVFSDNWRNFVKGSMWKPVRRLLGRGLATSDGEIWLRSRRLMQPLFSPKHLKVLVDHMVRVVAGAIPRFEHMAMTGEPIDMGREMMDLTQEVLLSTIFGASVDRRTSRALADAINAAFEAINTRLFLFFVPERVPLPGERALREAVATIDEAILRIFDERRHSQSERNDLLSLLLHARDDETGEKLAEKQVRDELVTLFVAGNDTTTASLTWLWHSLSENPEVERKLHAEVASVLGDRQPTFDDIAHLTYTKMVFQEALRLYPPVWFLPRFAVADDIIDGYPIPAGSTILVSAYATHRNPNLWERPEVFEPERFTPERSANRPRYAYYPFGGGPRQCIGMSFAYMEAQIITAMLMQKFRMRRVGGAAKPRSAITLRPQGGLPMIISRL